MKNTKVTIELLDSKWKTLTHDLSVLSEKFSKDQKRRYELIEQLKTLLKTFEIIGEFPDNFVIPKELLPERRGTIGDFIETILDEYGALTRPEIEVYLRQRNVSIGIENARIIIANAIKRDARCRFKILENGKVALNKNR